MRTHFSIKLLSRSPGRNGHVDNEHSPAHEPNTIGNVAELRQFALRLGSDLELRYLLRTGVA